MSGTVRVATWALVALAACGPRESPPPPPDLAAAADSQATAVAAPADDARSVALTEPTLFAITSFTQAEVDSGGPATEAIADFGFYLESRPFQDSLRALGVALVAKGDSLLVLRDGARTYRWSFTADSTRIAYVLVAPGVAPEISYGVRTSDDLLGWAASYRGRGRGGKPE